MNIRFYGSGGKSFARRVSTSAFLRLVQYSSDGIVSSGRIVQFGDGDARMWEKSCTARLPCDQRSVVLSYKSVGATHRQLVSRLVKNARIFGESDTLAVLDDWVRCYGDVHVCLS